MHIVMEGSPTRGFDIHGPFDTTDAAYHWASDHPDFGDEWWVMPLLVPSYGDETDEEPTTVGEDD